MSLFLTMNLKSIGIKDYVAKCVAVAVCVMGGGSLFHLLSGGGMKKHVYTFIYLYILWRSDTIVCQQNILRAIPVLVTSLIIGSIIYH